jgi:hypothetical protein
MRQTPGGGPPPAGANYTARTVLSVQVTPLDRLATITAAALSRGAALVGQPRFGIAAEDSIRKIVYAEAMSNAQRSAETVAASAGGRLGRLRTLTADDPAQYEQWQASYFPNEGPYDNAPRPPPEVVITTVIRGAWEILMPSPRPAAPLPPPHE